MVKAVTQLCPGILKVIALGVRITVIHSHEVLVNHQGFTVRGMLCHIKANWSIAAADVEAIVIRLNHQIIQ